MLTFKREVGEQSNVFSTLLTLGQLRKDQEPLPTPATLSHADTLEADGQRVQVALCDAARSNRPYGTYPSVDQEDKRQDDAAGENPSRDGKRDTWLYLTSPVIENE